MGKTHLFVGGLVAMGFDRSGDYLVTVSHSGRGVFAVKTWERISRDTRVVYPEHGRIEGIGPVAGMKIPVVERNEKKESVELESPDGRYLLLGESDGVTICENDA